MPTLQINTSGAWKNIVQFDDQKRSDVLAAVTGLAQVLGPDAKWCVLHEGGHREWLADIHLGMFPGWEDDPTKPPPDLEDVLVSAWDASEGKALVFMAWRGDNPPHRWYLTGCNEPLRLPVYAWGPVMAPHSDVPEALKREAQS